MGENDSFKINVLPTPSRTLELEIPQLIREDGEGKYDAEGNLVLPGKKRKVEAVAKVVQPSNTGQQVSLSTTALSRKKGRARFGVWAARQIDRTMRPQRPLATRDRTWRIDWAIGRRAMQLPFNIWDNASFFQELSPNGLCYGSDTAAHLCTYNDPAAAGWGRGIGAMLNTSVRSESDQVNAHLLPRYYTADQLEWPYVNFIEQHLRLIMRPGNATTTCRLLVINVWPKEDGVGLKDINTFTLGDFFSQASTGTATNAPCCQPLRGTRAGPNYAIAAVPPPICAFFAPFRGSGVENYDYKVITDKTWHTTPGDTSTRQVPYSFDIKQKQGHIELTTQTAYDENQYSAVVGRGRIIWGLFFEATTADYNTQPSLTQATETLNSYYGVYKGKWKLSPP